MCALLEPGFSIQEPAICKFSIPGQCDNEMGLVLTVPQGIESAVIALIAEGKLRICSGKGMLYPKAHAVAAMIQIALQLHAKLAREVGVVLSCNMLVEDTRATFRIGLLVQPGKLQVGVRADMPDLTIPGVEIIFIFSSNLYQI